MNVDRSTIVQDPTPAPAWSEEANAQGRAAYLAAERLMEARMTTAELAGRPLPVEAARLAELQAAVDDAVAKVDLAKAEVMATFPPVVEGSARQVSGPVGYRPSPLETTDSFLRARTALHAAQEVEGKARGVHTSYQMRVQEAGRNRYLAMTQKAGSS